MKSVTAVEALAAAGETAGDRRYIPEADLAFRWVPPGEYELGSPADSWGHKASEPLQVIHLQRGLWFAEIPVLQKSYQEIMGENPSFFQDPELPVEQVSWWEAKAYCAALAERVGFRGLRLPFEHEWEAACLAGLPPIAWAPGSAEAWQENGLRNCLYGQRGNPEGGSRAPLSASANAWGLREMLGNVWEWCENTYLEPGETAPAPDAGKSARGGSWASAPDFCRPSARYSCDPAASNHHLGFRVVLPAPPFEDE